MPNVTVKDRSCCAPNSTAGRAMCKTEDLLSCNLLMQPLFFTAFGRHLQAGGQTSQLMADFSVPNAEAVRIQRYSKPAS